MPDSLEGKIYRGEEARRFLSTPIGKMIIEAAEKEEMLSLEALATVDPHNEKEIMDIQQDIRVARAVPLWIQETIAEGKVAYDEYMEEEENR